MRRARRLPDRPQSPGLVAVDILGCPVLNLSERHWRSDGRCRCKPDTPIPRSPVGLELPDLPDDRIMTLPLPRPWWRS